MKSRFNNLQTPDRNLHTVEAVSIGQRRYRAVQPIGKSHLLIAAPFHMDWPASLDVKKWGGTVRGLSKDETLYMIAAAGQVLHRKQSHAAA